MSLNKSALKTSIKNMVNLGYTDLSSAVSAWVSAYNDYANGGSSYAQDESTDKISSVNSSGLQSGFTTAFTSNSASGASSGMETGAIAYYTGGAFATSVPPITKDPLAISDISAIVSNPGSGLASELLSIFSVLGTDADAKADQIATAFDNHAKSVQVLCTYLKTNPTPPPPVLTSTVTLAVS